MRERICYLGDDHLGGAAAYLAGIMTHFGLPFDHVASSESPPADMLTETYRLYVLSDYPAGRFQLGRMDDLAGRVRDGSGLLMIGGWESFHGRAGEYHGTRLADVLPVEMLDADDRRNCASPVWCGRSRTIPYSTSCLGMCRRESADSTPSLPVPAPKRCSRPYSARCRTARVRSS